MAATVHNGSITPGSNYTYTNNTNKNVRIVINYLSFGQSGSNPMLYIGTSQNANGDATTIAFQLASGQTYGKQLGFIRGDDRTASKANGSQGFQCPLEFFLAEGMHFIIDIAGNHNQNTMFNFIAITED